MPGRYFLTILIQIGTSTLGWLGMLVSKRITPLVVLSGTLANLATSSMVLPSSLGTASIVTSLSVLVRFLMSSLSGQGRLDEMRRVVSALSGSVIGPVEALRRQRQIAHQAPGKGHGKGGLFGFVDKDIEQLRKVARAAVGLKRGIDPHRLVGGVGLRLRFGFDPRSGSA